MIIIKFQCFEKTEDKLQGCLKCRFNHSKNRSNVALKMGINCFTKILRSFLAVRIGFSSQGPINEVMDQRVGVS